MHRTQSTLSVICLALIVLPFAQSEEPKPKTKPVAKTSTENAAKISFAFDGTPWKDVIQTLAETGDLAVHIGDLPVGSFTYSDSKSYTVNEAISRVNLFLLPEGYTLVRSGRLLSVINLSDPRSLKQLDSLAKLVTTKQLEALPDHDVVKCLFPLGDLPVEDAAEELAGLNLMTAPAEFSRTNRIMVVDTAEKLRTVQTLLKAFAPDQLNNGTVVKSFELQHADAEDILVVARPHLGLATGEMIGIDVSLSADPEGKNLFVTGVDDKVKLVENLVKSLDRKGTDLSVENGDVKLVSHPVTGGNLSSVYNVLLTLLADKDVRLSMDAEAESIVALADAEVHTRIEGTIKQLQASEKEFAVIQLKTVDPYLAISLIEQMLDLGNAERQVNAGIEAFTRHGNSRGIDLINRANGDEGPKIDADPVNRRLFVRAKKSMMLEIKKIVEQIDNASGVEDNETIRMLPIKGKQAEKLLETAARFWRGNNPVLLFPSAVTSDDAPRERVVASTVKMQFDQLFDPQPLQQTASVAPVPDTGVRILTRNIGGSGEAIRCQLTPTGLLMQCDDVKALTAFERHFRAISGPVDSIAAPPVVFYLKYTKPDDALRMLAELLDGAEAAKDGENGELVNGSTSSSYSSYLGSIVTSREGTTTMLNDSMTVVADNRLNRLIAQGTASDIELIEGYLKIVDKDGSITDVETYGKTYVIELKNTKASEVAEVLKEAYASRLPKSNNPAGAAGKTAAKPNPRTAKPAAKPERDLEPKMTIAVHEASNSLIVTAPEQLFKEVEKLAQVVDRRSEQTVRIINMENVPQAQLIQQIFGDRVRLGDSLTGTSSSKRSTRSRGR
jgi:type II secretory pathway component GspD/PulD (secretin)